MSESVSANQTLVFHLSALPRLEAAMGASVVRSTLAALDKEIRALTGRILRDEQNLAAVSDLPPGFWAFRYCATLRDAGTQTEKHHAILTAARQLGMEAAQAVFGGATARFVSLVVALLPQSCEAKDIPALLEKIPSCAELPEQKAIEDILAQGGLRTLLQPIVRFPDGATIGYEALSRGPVGSPVEFADKLFATAASMGRAIELEKACAWQALDWLNRARGENKIPAQHWLTVNLSGRSLADDRLRQALARPDVVVEITEHLPLDDARDLLPLIDELRGKGAQLALDDTGCGFADWQTAETLRPDFVKLCITIIRSVGRGSEEVLDDLGEVIARLQEARIKVLAEGVENEREAGLLAQFPIDYAQGWLYGKPYPAP